MARSERIVASLAALVACLLIALPVHAQTSGARVDDNGQISDPALQARYEDLTHQLRCLVCQNESVADSNAFLAQDLRRQVREMLLAGRSDADILDFMTARYGEFVRYSPPLEGKTLLLWGAPFACVAIGFVIVLRIVRRRSRMPLDADPPAEV